MLRRFEPLWIQFGKLISIVRSLRGIHFYYKTLECFIGGGDSMLYVLDVIDAKRFMLVTLIDGVFKGHVVFGGYIEYVQSLILFIIIFP